jgi:hypothetical protein
MSPDFAGGGTPPVLFGLAGADGGLGTSPLRAVLDRGHAQRAGQRTLEVEAARALALVDDERRQDDDGTGTTA